MAENTVGTFFTFLDMLMPQRAECEKMMEWKSVGIIIANHVCRQTAEEVPAGADMDKGISGRGGGTLQQWKDTEQSERATGWMETHTKKTAISQGSYHYNPLLTGQSTFQHTANLSNLKMLLHTHCIQIGIQTIIRTFADS